MFGVGGIFATQVQGLHGGPAALVGVVFGLGARGEIPFALAAGAPALEPDAPGSAAVRLGAAPLDRSPLDVWLDVIFGTDG